MYCEFYQLRERPFNVTADPKFLYLNARYREALASLQYGITQRKGFITLIGEAGTGKTTLLKKLLDDLDPNTRTVFIFNTNVTFDEILEYIFAEFDLPVHNGKRLYMLQRLNAFLLEELQQGRNVALLIDEAQDLDQTALEDLRLLSNLETAKEKILQIVLSGQPELGQKLGSPALRQLRQRVAINCRLLPLTREEISEYIQSRLIAAGGVDPKLFTRDAEDRIYEISMGIPRLVNVVCDNALVIGYALGKKRIGAEVVTEAAADLLTMEPATETPESTEPVPTTALPSLSRSRRWSQLGVVTVVFVAIVVGLLSVGRSLLRRDPVQMPNPAVARPPLEVISPSQRIDAESWREPRNGPPEARQQPEPLGAQRSGWGDAVPAPRQESPSSAVAGSSSGAPVGTSERPSNANAPTNLVANAKPADQQFIATGGVPPQDVERPGVGEQPSAAGIPTSAGQGVVSPKSGDSSGSPSEQAATALHLAAPARSVDERTGSPLVASDGPSVARGIDGQAAPAGDPRAEPDGRAPVDGVISLALEHYEPVTISPGQSISELAVRKYGQASHTILDLVKLANPALRNVDVVSVGQTLQLPELDDGHVVIRQSDGLFGLLLLSSPAWQRVKSLEAGLRQRGFSARVQTTDFGPGRTVYRLLVSDMSSREAALTTGKKLRRLLREDEQIAALAR